MSNEQNCLFGTQRQIEYTIYSDKIKKSRQSTYIRCLPVCLFVSIKRQNDWTDRARILCDPRESLWMTEFSKICLYQNVIFEIFFIESAKLCLFLFYSKCKENMFTIEIEDGRTRLKSLVFLKKKLAISY